MKPGVGEVLHGLQGRGEGALAADRIVDLGRGAIERDLHVDVVAGRQLLRDLWSDAAAVGGELHADVVRGGVVDELPEVGPHGGLAAADVHVEHLHPLELVDDGLALLGAELAGVPPAGARQAVDAGQVAGVRELPGEADGGVEAVLELVDERSDGGGRRRDRGHATSSRQIVWDAASVASADRYRASSCSATPAASHAARADGASANASTTASRVGCFRNDRRRVPKWYTSAPKRSGRMET